MMYKYVKSTLILFAILTIISGVFYPVTVTLISQILFPYQANGSMLVVRGRLTGSEQIGQFFDDPGYFWGRPSMTAGMPYNAASSSGSNLAPSNPVFIAQVRARAQSLTTQPAATGPVPIDLVTASASGLDAHISVESAGYQIGRVAQARHLDEGVVAALVARYTESRQWGFLGEPRVNVLKINLALDEIQ